MAEVERMRSVLQAVVAAFVVVVGRMVGSIEGPEAPPLQSGLLQLSRLARGELEG